MSTAISEAVDLASKDNPVLSGTERCANDVTYSNEKDTSSPPEQETVAKLQKQVADLTKKLEKVDQLFDKINVEELLEKDEETKPDLKKGEESSEAVKAGKKVTGEQKDKEQNGSLAECKVLHVKPGISWRHKLGEITAGRLKRYAMLVCYEESRITTAEKPGNEPSPSGIPVSIIINSVRLDELLQDFSQNLLPEASHVPYIVPRPFKVFVALYAKFKSGLQDLEYTFEGPETTDDDVSNKPLPSSTSEPSSDKSEDDPVKSQHEDLMLMRCFIRMCENHLARFFKIQSQVADATLKRISYQNLWYLFKPGDIIIGRGEAGSRLGDTAEAYCVYCPTSSRPPQKILAFAWDASFWQKHNVSPPEYLKDNISQPDDFHLFSYYWHFNGSRFTPQQKLVVIKPFEGEKDITKLTYFPKQFCEADNPILNYLIEKGETFRKLRYGHGVYKGMNLQPQPPKFVDEEVFIDFPSGCEANVESIGDYLEEGTLSLPFTDEEEDYGHRCDKQPHCWTCDINISVSKLEMKRASDFRVTGKYALTVSPEDFPKLSEDNLVMLPSTLIGYGLKSKDWYLLDMYKLKMTETTESKRQQSFEHLVIPSKTKRLLQALVKNHGTTTDNSGGNEDDLKNEVDIVKGKDNEEKAIKVSFNRSKLLDWAEGHFDEVKDKKSDGLSTATWNGRQIRNAFQTAIAIASFERVKRLEGKNLSEEEALKKRSTKYRTIQLKSEHFDTVSKVVGEFEDYLVKCRGDDADRASKSCWRKDSHEPGAPRLSAYPKPKDLFGRSENSSRKGRDEGFADIRGLKGKKPESNDSDDERQDSNRAASKNTAKSKGWGKQQDDDASSDSESESSDEED
ncbi:P-loop containing nucleoside triphosphate hydrolase [Colletotrichum sp. SAR11_240]|nr:P-loop containing nucleoside triphosphate hydrolase [Colletotrichum sp. SAR11_240]